MTLWQRPHLFVWDWTAAPVELLQPLYPTYGTVHVHLIDHGDVPRSYVQQLKEIGFAVLGVVGEYDADGKPWQRWHEPLEAFSLAQERLGVIGADFNFEDRWEEHDRISQGQWSLNLTTEFRRRWPRRNVCLNTYDECGYIFLRQWANAGARLYLQTYKGGVEPPQMIPVAHLHAWAITRGWPVKKIGMFRPCLGVFGSPRVPVAEQVSSMVEAGSKGFLAYYADGADLGEPERYLEPLARQAIAAGAAVTI